MSYGRSAVRTVRSRASPEAVFERLDDPTAPGIAYAKPSAMMPGRTMRYSLTRGGERPSGR